MKCTFCGKEIPRGTGIMLITKAAKVSYFCSSKCEKNTLLKRNPAKTRWTEKGRKSRGK